MQSSGLGQEVGWTRAGIASTPPPEQTTEGVASMPQQLPSGRWRTRVRHPRTGKQISTRNIIGGPDTYATKQAATDAEEEARRVIRSGARLGVTVKEFWRDWTTDPLWLRPAKS